MKVILKENVESLGQAGEIVDVKSGYARNFLLPKKFALPATPQNLKVYEQEKNRIDQQMLRDQREAEALAEKLGAVSLTATVAVGEEDKVFGSVTNQVIADLLKAKGFEIDRRKIMLDEPIKALGVYDVSIKLHPEVVPQVKVWVVKE